MSSLVGTQTIDEKWGCDLNPFDRRLHYGQFVCVGFEPVDGLHPSVPPLNVAHFCDIPLNLNYQNIEPTREHCGNRCALYSLSHRKTCTSCEFTDSGDFAYDCSNIYPNIECPIRDASGECQEGHMFWDCKSNDGRNTSIIADYSCRTVHAQNLLHPSIPVDMSMLVNCDDFEFRAPTLDSCESRCLLATADASTYSDICRSCTLLQSGEFAYDCSNLFPGIECPQRDANGNCGGQHVHWECDPFFETPGFSCRAERIPAFIYDDKDQGDMEVRCANDISGKTIGDCEYPFCEINTGIFGLYNYGNEKEVTQIKQDLQTGERTIVACSSCQVLPSGGFAYDCVNAFPNITCPVLFPNGTCAKTSNASEESVDDLVSQFETYLPDVNEILQMVNQSAAFKKSDD